MGEYIYEGIPNSIIRSRYQIRRRSGRLRHYIRLSVSAQRHAVEKPNSRPRRQTPLFASRRFLGCGLREVIEEAAGARGRKRRRRSVARKWYDERRAPHRSARAMCPQSAPPAGGTRTHVHALTHTHAHTHIQLTIKYLLSNWFWCKNH